MLHLYTWISAFDLALYLPLVRFLANQIATLDLFLCMNPSIYQAINSLKYGVVKVFHNWQGIGIMEEIKSGKMPNFPTDSLSTSIQLSHFLIFIAV